MGSATRRLIGTCFGVGRLPLAPGTFASALTVAVFFWIYGEGDSLFGAPLCTPEHGVALACLGFICVLGVAVGRHAKDDYGEEDPPSFVLDEVVGQGIALLPLLPGYLEPTGVVVAFLAFRLADIFKFPPCGWLERRGGGLGIMADDVAAGGYGALAVFALGVLR